MPVQAGRETPRGGREVKVEVRIGDPEAHCFETAGAFWTVIGTGPALPAGLEDRFARDPDAAATLCSEVGDAVVLKVDLDGDRAVQVTLWKGITSGYELYYAVRPGGEILVGDYFRNLLTALPPAERLVSDRITVDHFLFRSVPGAESYCSNILRTGHGEQITIRPDTGAVKARLFDRVTDHAEPARQQDYLDWIDTALESALASFESRSDAANLLSGGVDSSLIHTYLGTGVPGLYVDRTAGTEDFESRYAKQAAKLLNTRLDTVVYDMSAFLDDLAESVRTSGLPTMFYQSVFYLPVWRGPYKKVVMGLHADTLLGFGVRSTLIAARFASAPGNLFLRAAGPVLDLTQRLNMIQPQAQQLRRPLDDPYGIAGQVSLRSDLGLVERGFGKSLVRERLERRLAYTLDRVATPDPGTKPVMRGLDLAHLVSNFCEDGISRVRHGASAHKTAVCAPFHSRQVLAAVRRIPPEHRYAKGLEGKYLLKYLLKRRLPDYPINQRKGQSTVPFDQLYSTGPLSRIWEHYEVPPWLAEFGTRNGETVPNGAVQSAVSWAVWQREVLSNPQLKADSWLRSFAWPPLAPEGTS